MGLTPQNNQTSPDKEPINTTIFYLAGKLCLFKMVSPEVHAISTLFLRSTRVPQAARKQFPFESLPCYCSNVRVASFSARPLQRSHYPPELSALYSHSSRSPVIALQLALRICNTISRWGNDCCWIFSPQVTIKNKNGGRITFIYLRLVCSEQMINAIFFS